MNTSPSADTTRMSVHVVTNLQDQVTDKNATAVKTKTVINTLEANDDVAKMLSIHANLLMLDTPVGPSVQAIGDINVAVKAQERAAHYNGLSTDGILMTVVTLVTDNAELAIKQKDVASSPALEHAYSNHKINDKGEHILNIVLDNKAMAHKNLYGMVPKPANIALMISNMMGNVEKCDKTLAKQLVV